MQLAIAIARVYEGDEGRVLRKILQEDVLALAGQEGNRWLASWAFWMLGRKDMAVRALVVRTCLHNPPQYLSPNGDADRSPDPSICPH